MSLVISGTTRVCGLLGFPVQHSFSSVMHNAAFSLLGLDYVYVSFCVAPEELCAAVMAVRSLGLVGVNVTIPHKEKAITFLDEVTPGAQLTGAVNTIVNRGGKLCGYNTDGVGFLRALQEEVNFSPAGRTALILGAGGAARAASVELALAGAQEILLANRTPERAEGLTRLLTEHTPAGARIVLWSEQAMAEAVRRSDLIVQTTPVGMSPDEDSCVDFPFEQLRPGQVVCDLVYNPPLTKFLRHAGRIAGVRTVGGAGMLLNQGALAFELWTGVKAPVDIMRRALQEVLS